MTFKLYVMRHGDALMNAPQDSLRPLSRLGHEQAVESSRYLKSRLPESNPIDLVLISPYLRAQETAKNLVDCLAYEGKQVTCDGITPNDNPDDVIALLSGYLAESANESVLMVSHQPLVSALIGRLVTGNYHDGAPMGTASIACLEMSTVGIGMAELSWLKHSQV